MEKTAYKRIYDSEEIVVDYRNGTIRISVFEDGHWKDEHFVELSADVVEVVRCKDCKYWIEGRHHTGRCNALIQFHDAERYVVDEGHFCSYGERRTDG